MNYNITRQGRFFGTQEALEKDMEEFALERVHVQGVGTYSYETQLYVHKEGDADHRIYWRLLTDDVDRRHQVGGMEFSHITFHHTVQSVKEISWVLTRLRFPQAYQ